MLHYLYLPSKSAAEKAAVRLRAQRFTTEERRGADGVNWLVLAKHQVVPSESVMAAARQIMEGLTAPLNGEYDGWEAEVVQHDGGISSPSRTADVNCHASAMASNGKTTPQRMTHSAGWPPR